MRRVVLCRRGGRGEPGLHRHRLAKDLLQVSFLPPITLTFPLQGLGISTGCKSCWLYFGCPVGEMFLGMKQMSLPHLKYMSTYIYFFLPPVNHRANLFLRAETWKRYVSGRKYNQKKWLNFLICWTQMKQISWRIQEIKSQMQKLDVSNKSSLLPKTDRAEMFFMFQIVSDCKECAYLAVTLIGHSFPWPA